MARKNIRKSKRRDTEYEDRRDTKPSRQPGDDINARNNDVDIDNPTIGETNVETANDTGIGDSGLNREKLTNYTSNHSADA